MPDFPSDQKLSSKATIEKYNGMEIPFDPAMLSFPQQLFQLLQIAENNHQQEIISWAEDGKSFTVHDPNKFEAKLLVKYFQMRKYASFTRQLCAYGFSCVRKGRKPGLCKNSLCLISFSVLFPFQLTASFSSRLSPQLHP